MLLAVFFVVAGTMHFVAPDAYVRIVPPALPGPRLLVVVSGVAEILGGVAWPFFPPIFTPLFPTCRFPESLAKTGRNGFDCLCKSP